ncbi:uncharacterized protein LOC116308173 [Actinia tenebrosa]|uniref:Uncharacterized protein LOC116308173 n=1 Tax=Actinia tenebrosa TaxID=6105 RepID=A0A6P8JCZ4_ACTTE|nr:uncharacterized protein LOC116308173 [Actinia tenebrosa]
MEYDLVIEASSLFLLNSAVKENPSLSNDNKTQVSPEVQGLCSSAVLDHSVFPKDVFSAETSFLTPDRVIEEIGVCGRGLSQPLKSDRNNNTKQESTRILDIIKYSPKFLRKKNSKQPCKNVSHYVEESNGGLQGASNQKFENHENPGTVSPKMGFRKTFQSSVNQKDTAVTEKMKTTATRNCKSATSDKEIPEFGPSKGRKNWRKVKAALKRMNDGGEQLKSMSLASSEENIQGVAGKLRINLSSETSIDDDDDDEEDIYQRLKAFLNSSDKKFKTPWSPRSPRLQLRSNKYSFWPKGAEAGGVPYAITPMVEEENGVNQFPVLKSKRYPLGMRRCSAPEPVLRREAEAFSFIKKGKDMKINSQKKSIKNKKANHGDPKPYDRVEHEVRQRMRLVMEKNLETLTEYCPEICGQLSSTISEEITKYLRSTDIFSEDVQKKCVCLVYIGAVKDDGIHAAVRCMWIPGEDRLVVFDYQNNSLYALAIVFTASC